MNQNKNRKKSPKIRWKIFGFMLIPTMLLLVILWITQTVLLGLFYSGIKTQELKDTTQNVINSMDSSDIQNRILFWSSNGNINIRVVDTAAFESLYSTGEAFDSVTYGLGTFGLWEMYKDAVSNGGELVRYYSEGNGFERFGGFEKESDFNPDKYADSENTENFDRQNESDDGVKNYRKFFERVPRPAFYENIGKHNDLLYVKIASLDDGSEIMVVADTRISPLDSTVVTLRMQLIWCSGITIVIALVLSFFMAKKISRPIEKTTKSAKILAEGNFDATFEGRGYREIEELNDTLNYASAELGKVESLRRELMANVSHDMRTPLTMIVGYSEAMRDIPGENNPENVQVIIDEANRLTEFVNSVLDLSKLQSGMEKMEVAKTDITEMLVKAAERYRRLMAETGLEINLEYDGHVNVICDEGKMVQVLHNLIDNAINYSKDPKRVIIRQITDNETYVRIEICDNGEGINPDELPYIWDRYYKTDRAHKRNVAGSGIGLSIVKEILKMHGARFGVETKENVGSKFWFELKIK